MSLLKETHKYVEHKITLYCSGNNWKPKQAMQGTHFCCVIRFMELFQQVLR